MHMSTWDRRCNWGKGPRRINALLVTKILLTHFFLENFVLPSIPLSKIKFLNPLRVCINFDQAFLPVIFVIFFGILSVIPLERYEFSHPCKVAWQDHKPESSRCKRGMYFYISILVIVVIVWNLNNYMLHVYIII